MKKVLLTLILLAATILPAVAYDFSAVAPSGQTLYYNIVDGGVEVTYPVTNITDEVYCGYPPCYVGSGEIEIYVVYGSYDYVSGQSQHFDKPIGDLEIPSTVSWNGTTYSVISIREYAFCGCTGLTSIIIPSSVTTIGERAFYYCYNLTSVNIGGSSIGKYAFAWCCGITTLTITNSVTSIGNNAFSRCTGLTSVTFGNSVTLIDWNAFDCCTELTSVTIPNSVDSIGLGAFCGCTGLTSIIVESGNIVYDSRNNCNAIIKTGTNTLISGCKNTVIPNSVTSIGSQAFYGCSGITGNLTIPNFVTSIGASAFNNCTGLTSVTIGNSVTSIGNWSFQGCAALTEIHSLANMAPTLGENAFNGVNSAIPVYVPCGREAHYYGNWTYFSNIIENSAASFSAVSNDNTMGSVQILTMPTCTNPQAVVYAVANSGYQFDHWSDNSTSNPYSLTVNEDMELTAYFSPIGSQPTTYYTITVTTNDAEMGTVTGGGSFAEGTTTTIAATANSGYHFVQWQDGNTEASRSITVTADAEYTAYFAANGANEYTITVIAQNPSMGSTTGSGTFAYGTVTTITAEPYEGYYFVQWNDGNTQRIRTITVTGNATYTAYFDRSNGIDDITSDQIKIYSRGSEIVIEGADNSDALIYDVMGRIVHKGRIEAPIYVNAMGVYMVKIGGRQPRKVVVR